MNDDEKKEIKFPCSNKNNNYTTIYDCEHYCENNQICDNYISIINDIS